jgi:hypothetical protein
MGFARMINVAKKYVVSRALSKIDWNTHLVRRDFDTLVTDFDSDFSRPEMKKT